MSWIAAAGRTLLALGLAVGLGALYGYPREAVILVLLGLVGFWLYQMYRVQEWLKEPNEAPPEAYGV